MFSALTPPAAIAACAAWTWTEIISFLQILHLKRCLQIKPEGQLGNVPSGCPRRFRKLYALQQLRTHHVPMHFRWPSLLWKKNHDFIFLNTTLETMFPVFPPKLNTGVGMTWWGWKYSSNCLINSSLVQLQDVIKNIPDSSRRLNVFLRYVSLSSFALPPKL